MHNPIVRGTSQDLDVSKRGNSPRRQRPSLCLLAPRSASLPDRTYAWNDRRLGRRQ